MGAQPAWETWSSTGPAEAGGDDGKRVLVPYCGTRIADAALEVAADWSRALAAEAWVLYVRPWDALQGHGRVFLDTKPEARALVLKAVTTLRGHGVAASGVVREANRPHIADAIIAEAEALGPCTVVLGTHARGLLGMLVLGSTSHTVARRSSRRVILVRVPPAKTKPQRRWLASPG